MKRNIARHLKEKGEFHIEIVWTLPPQLARYRRSVSGEDVQVEKPTPESDDAQSGSEHTTAQQHESSGDPGTGNEGIIQDG